MRSLAFSPALKKLNAYTERDLRIAERVGNQVAGAIVNAKMYEEMKRMVEHIETRLPNQHLFGSDSGRL